MPARSWHRPEPFNPDHVVSAFLCGKPELDELLQKRALANQISGGTKTHVVVEEWRVIGFYALANGAIAHSDVRGRTRRNMPDPIPAVILAKMAVDEKHRRGELGSARLYSNPPLRRPWPQRGPSV